MRHSPIVAGALLALAVLAGCAAPAARTEAPLAAGWQEHSRPLFLTGPGPAPGTYSWLVPGNLPPGRYQVISREGDHVQLVDGSTFTIDDPFKRIHVLLSPGVNGVEAVEESYVLRPH